jgi:hypothetical protein
MDIIEVKFFDREQWQLFGFYVNDEKGIRQMETDLRAFLDLEPDDSDVHITPYSLNKNFWSH